MSAQMDCCISQFMARKQFQGQQKSSLKANFFVDLYTLKPISLRRGLVREQIRHVFEQFILLAGNFGFLNSPRASPATGPGPWRGINVRGLANWGDPIRVERGLVLVNLYL